MFSPANIRKDFPILGRHNSSNNQLVYLDNAATTQKPNAVIDAISNYYKNNNSNIHRGVHFLGVEATEHYEDSREKVRTFINASFAREIIFVRGTTEAINLVASSFLAPNFKPGDEILITTMEHHSNLIPWQQLAKKQQGTLKVIPINIDCDLELSKVEELINSNTRLVALTHISNALGTINPVKEVVEIAHRNGVPVLIDGAQAVGHQPVDVTGLGCDFYAFSGHKMFGPTGIGVLYIKNEFLGKMRPYQFGGEMIKKVSFTESTFADHPHYFEAGTPDIAGVIGLGAAIDYLIGLDLNFVKEYTETLTTLAFDLLQEIEGVEIIGNPLNRGSIISFQMKDIHPHDIASILDAEGIAVRAGHHCTMPLMELLGIPGTTRVSFSIYNTEIEIEVLVKGLYKVKQIFS
ncbi:MAG: cysteine desulfurase [Bacteroidetes bacterium]|nr:cysteine desulfurase [Bacteroidota bacterium]MDA1121556.1 cysteine desulfurase [Bacteroidota bacterium]